MLNDNRVRSHKGENRSTERRRKRATKYDDERDQLAARKPPSVCGDLAKLPAALGPLTKRPSWVNWCWEQAKNQTTGKLQWTKVPYQPRRPSANASTTRPETWADYRTALSVYQDGRADGIGYCLLDGDIGAFDLDDCRDPATGSIAPWAQHLVERVASYAEITVSGRGLRIIGRARGTKLHRQQRITSGGKLETYRRAERFIVITGKALPETPQQLTHIDKHMDEVVAELDAEKREKRASAGGALIELPAHLRALLHVEGNGGYPSRSELVFAFLSAAIRAGVADATIVEACLD
jgi:hypothetical protein